MDDALFVRRLERVADLIEDVDDVGERQRAMLLPQPLVEGLALQPLHDEVAAPVGEPPEAEDVDDVGMADGVDGARFEREARDRAGVRRQRAATSL